jgi:hypothetical protein
LACSALHCRALATARVQWGPLGSQVGSLCKEKVAIPVRKSLDSNNNRTVGPMTLSETIPVRKSLDSNNNRTVGPSSWGPRSWGPRKIDFRPVGIKNGFFVHRYQVWVSYGTVRYGMKALWSRELWSPGNQEKLTLCRSVLNMFLFIVNKKFGYLWYGTVRYGRFWGFSFPRALLLGILGTWEGSGRLARGQKSAGQNTGYREEGKTGNPL